MINKEILLNLPQHTYPIYIGENIYNNSELLTKHIHGSTVMLLSNNTVAPIYLSALQQALTNTQYDTLILPDGEAHKNFTSWSTLLDSLAAKQHHRDTTLITLGGGVIGDIGGFAAACYQRGIAVIHIPTTLLAQVDSSIGGKTAINHPVGKNLIGAFHQPNAVIIDTACLTTLPKREFKAGLAEIIKAALIYDADFFHWLEKNYLDLLSLQTTALTTAISRACEIKQSIVVQDEKEENIRALLNLGHTFGHAIEKLLGYGQWLHGEAVAAGIILASQVSLYREQISANDYQRINNLLNNIGLPTRLPNALSMTDIINNMKMDKKVKNNKLRFVLLDAIGSASIYDDVDLSTLMHAATSFY